eukprot:2935-Heterococcus_DN1.PRE.4
MPTLFWAARPSTTVTWSCHQRSLVQLCPACEHGEAPVRLSARGHRHQQHLHLALREHGPGLHRLALEAYAAGAVGGQAEQAPGGIGCAVQRQRPYHIVLPVKPWSFSFIGKGPCKSVSSDWAVPQCLHCAACCPVRQGQELKR